MNKFLSKIKSISRKNIIFLSVAILIVVTIIGLSFYTNKSYAATDGTYGTCHWEIDDNGKLTLSPQTGDTTCTLGIVSTYTSIPWYSNRGGVLSVEVEEGVIANADSRYLFSYLENATSMNVSNLDTSRVTNMYDMFFRCTSLTSLDVTGFNTSSVTDMQQMFNDCSSLTSLDVTHFDTSDLINMYAMFYNCSSLTSLDLSNFNTSNVTGMNAIFAHCGNLTSLNLSSFDTSKVTSMSSMFENCSSLTSLNLSNFNVSNVIYMNQMFKSCNSLTNINLSNFSASSVTDMTYMFAYCNSLTSLDLSDFNTNSVTKMAAMFESCSSLTELDLSSFETSNVTTMSSMFFNCEKLTSIDLSSFNTRNVITMSGIFKNCGSLISLDLSNLNTNNVTSMNNMFENCTSLTSLNVSSFETGNVTTMNSMFSHCKSLISLDVTGFNTSNVTDMFWMFYDCSSLTSLDVTHFETSSVTTMQWMFFLCSSLTELDLSSFDMTTVTNVSSMFQNVGANQNEGCKITLNNTFNKTYANNSSYWFPWSYYAKEVSGELTGFYTLAEMKTETTSLGNDEFITWVPVYSVTYDGNGGTINNNNTLVKTYRIGNKINTNRINATKSENTLVGWKNTQGSYATITISKNKESKNAYGSRYSKNVLIDGNINLYAQYKTRQDDTSMDITRNVSGVANAVSNTFGYTITPDSNNPGTVSGISSTFDIVFNNETPTDGVATKGKNINFDGATYPKPEDYKFTIRETSSTDNTTYPKSNDEWEVMVSVRNVTDLDDEPSGEYDRTVVIRKTGETQKSSTGMLFESKGAFTSINISNTLEGNMADVDEYFKIKVNVGGESGLNYTLSGLDSSVTYNGETITNPSAITSGTDTYIYLKHGQTAVIGEQNDLGEIKSGVTYRVTEEGASSYTTMINETSGKDSGELETNLNGNTVSIVNTYNESVVTGVILKYIPYLVMVFAIISGIILMIKSKKRNDID